MPTPHTPTPPWTCARLAKLCNVRTDTVWRWCREGRIAAIKIGKSYLIPDHVVAAFCESPSEKKPT